MKPEARLLARLMSDLSEDYFCAGWLDGCEYALWADLTGSVSEDEKGWGISEADKEELRVAQQLAGGWIVWSEEKGETEFLPLKDWLEHLVRRVPPSVAEQAPNSVQ
jgi:hypothetical protein